MFYTQMQLFHTDKQERAMVAVLDQAELYSCAWVV